MEFRTYRSGDETRLAALFNRCFPGGITRNADSWKWRYINHPDFDPEGVIIAEEGGEIQGYAVDMPRKPHFFKGQKIKIVVGDDLCVLPDARGSGLGTRLVKAVMSYAEEDEALLLVYVGKGGGSHKICTALGWTGTDEFFHFRSTRRTKAIPVSRVDQNSKRATVRRLSEKNIDEVIDFVNSTNSKKIPCPVMDRSEYTWRYLTHQNCNSDSIFLAEEGKKIVGHIAVSSHPTSITQEPFVILSEPCGDIQEILQSIDSAKCPEVNVATTPQNCTQYESAGFSLVATGVVMVRDYTGSEILKDIHKDPKGTEWYLFPESTFGAP